MSLQGRVERRLSPLRSKKARAHARRSLTGRLSALLCTVAILVCGRAAAQSAGGPVDLQLFRPAIDSRGLFSINGSEVLGHLDVSFGLIVNWSRRPLSMRGLATDTSFGRSRYDIDNLVTGNLQAAIGLFRHFELGLGIPLTFWNGDTRPDPQPEDAGKIDAQGAGDLGIHVKGRLLNNSAYPLGLSAMASVYLPTGDDEAFLGSGRVALWPRLILDRLLFSGRLKLALNVGAMFRLGSASGAAGIADNTWQDTRQCRVLGQDEPSLTADCGTGRIIETKHDLTYGLGGALAIVPERFEFVVELVGQTGFEGFADPDRFNSANELLAGFKLYLARSSYMTIGAGRALRGASGNHQYGAPDVRVFLGIVFEPNIGDRDGDGIKDDVDKCPDEPEDIDDFRDEDGCPDPDNDGDGILDKDDKCPNDPEDKDGHEDEDGCPEKEAQDRDADGIPDDKDKCPDQPEDKDGFEDEDGCPDPDNDKDGILDVDDLCPNEAEDKDGFEDEDGCPDPDNDKDRILDVDDKCPNKPETYNGYQDEDGCPDEGRVIVHKGSIQILDKIYFETAKAVIKPVSYPILNAIAATLKGNPQILLVEIQGHADERGRADYNQELTERRANSVRRYLVDKGVQPSRLTARGYGESRPVDRRHTAAAWAKNRRSEFVIRKRAE